MAASDALQPLRSAWRLLRLSSLPRDLLAGHVRAYAPLAALEWQRECSAWRRSALLWVLGLAGGLGALGLGGVALMLWAVVPAAQVHAPWLLWAVPLLPALLALLCLSMARGRARAAPFAGVRRQLAADLAFLRGAPDQGSVPRS